jgi:drug/metabolite transporter (DMT)-like permease
MRVSSSRESISQVSKGNVIFFLFALGSHTGWGANPVLARYLQTVSNLPTLSLLSVGHLLVTGIMLVLFRKHIKRHYFSNPFLWFLTLAAISRAITNLLSARYTLSIYVQLINLLTPFVVVFLAKTIFNEPVPPYTGRAIVFALVGSIMMMSNDLLAIRTGQGLTSSDFLGISLAILATFFLAIYFLLVRRSAVNKIPAEAVFFNQIIGLAAVTTLLSPIVGEDWRVWATLESKDLTIFVIYVLGVLIGSNLGQITAIRHLGASLVSSLQGWRLISALLLASVLLSERMTSIYQFAGAAIVIATITWYLWAQSDAQKSYNE